MFYAQRLSSLDLAILIVIYTMLGFGLNIVVGLAGLLDLGYVAFYAVGAYSYALLAHYFGLSFWICLPLAGILAAFAGLLLGFPVLRLRGDYLAIVTLGFGEIIRLILLNWQNFTGGPNGISAIPGPTFFGLPFTAADDGFAATFGLAFSPAQRIVFLYYVILALALLTNWVTLRLRRLPIGRAWEALREDEIACRALGINTTIDQAHRVCHGRDVRRLRRRVLRDAAGLHQSGIFTFGESALVLAIVVLGGMGSQLGVAVAATVMLGGFELFREFDQYRMLVFGAAMVAIMIYRPRGLVSTRTPSVFLHQRKAVPAAIVQDARTGVETPDMRSAGNSHGRASDHALRRPARRQRSLFRCARARDHGADRAERRRQDHAVQLHHRLLPADGRAVAARASGRRIVPARAPARVPHRARGARRAHVPERAAVRRHDASGKSPGRPAQPADAGLRLHRARAVRLARLRARRSRAIDKARYWLDRVGLAARADDPAGALPYGAQRRLEIARAMCTDPVLLCLDEPAAGLNNRESAELNEFLRAIRDEHGTSILLIEHDMGVVMEISDHIVVLDYGVKIADGAPRTKCAATPR